MRIPDIRAFPRRASATWQLVNAIHEGNSEKANSALEQGAASYSYFALWALHKKQKDILQKLLESGANPETRNSLGQTLLHQAVQMQNFELVKILLDFADPNAKTGGEGFPVLWLAVMKSKTSLLLFSENFDLQQAGGFRPEEVTRFRKQTKLEICRLLIEKGANPYQAGGHEFGLHGMVGLNTFDIVRKEYITDAEMKESFEKILQRSKHRPVEVAVYGEPLSKGRGSLRP